MKKAALIIAGVLVTLGLVLGACAFLFAEGDIMKIGSSEIETNTYTVSDPFSRIDIEDIECDVILKRSDSGDCRVVCREAEKMKHSVGVEDGTLKIRVEDTGTWIDRIVVFSRQLSVTVYLPETAYESLRIRATTGDAEVPAAFTFGQAEISLTTGDCGLGASVSGRLKIKTTTGDVRLEGITAGEIDLTVTTGHMKLSSVACEGALSMSVSTGKVTMDGVTCGSLTSGGGTGDITLKDVVASGTMEITRGTGDVRFDRSDAAVIRVRTSTGDVTGSLRSGKVFSTHTSTGSVNVPGSAAGGGTCEISTGTGSIRIRVE